MDIGSLYSFVSLSTDWLIVIAVGLAAAFASYMAGTNRATSFVLAMPLSLFALPLLSETAYVGPLVEGLTTPTLEAAVWAALFVLLFLVIQRMTSTYSDDSSGVPQALVAGAASAVVLVACWIQVPALASIWEFGPAVSAVFGTPYMLLWLLGAFAALAFVRR